MNEIEEYLLMIFLEDLGHWDEDLFEWCSCFSERWRIFKNEELGRTIPEEFEFFIGDNTIEHMRKGDGVNILTSLIASRDSFYKTKIKITVVEE